MKKRSKTIKRKTRETNITVRLNIDGSGKSKISTGIGILDHMLELFAFHGLFDLEIKALGDLKIDIHHTNEDIGIVLGDAFKEALGDKEGIKRSGYFSWPMEDVVANVAVDISGRGFFKGIIREPAGYPEPQDETGYSFAYANHFFEAFAKKTGMNLSIKLLNSTTDLHTNLEPIFKALGKTLDEATTVDPRRKGVPSTKGIID
ncbi:MAG: imidazoleglycerol-phosphate dehydratase [Candidatus Omnitrophica bacterium]|nr:imidazoleglycerol-phosphate dehydratase [Candidatus Omnitrophota bacterium]MBU4345899.1 imidazoleglycerol-phosphate dehydratase [Candidatus Omnitrophota bacterium]MBU4473044.1 imidazoleglycerol-phosphate dehydratase [Candidatus Omnitrophota bacterium]MCG2706665.1 imidazoleglycerol-phosphate dehydratase [Candidatus Omnitrophota bacterium]